MTSAFNDTRRIQESIAIYLPPNVEDTTNAAYNDMRTGLAGFLAARGEQIASTQDAERIAKEGISLPIDPNLSVSDLKKIIKIINSF